MHSMYFSATFKLVEEKKIKSTLNFPDSVRHMRCGEKEAGLGTLSSVLSTVGVKAMTTQLIT